MVTDRSYDNWMNGGLLEVERGARLLRPPGGVTALLITEPQPWRQGVLTNAVELAAALLYTRVICVKILISMIPLR